MKQKSKARKIISGFLGVLFVVLVVVGVIVCSYVLSQPSREGVSAALTNGKWVDKDKKISFEFGQDGKFEILHTDNNKKIATGYFKINEDEDKIKLFVLPKDRDESVDMSISLKFFSSISYHDLQYTDVTKQNNEDTIKDDSSCKFIFSSEDDSGEVYSCKREDAKSTLYKKKEKL